ncbi:uncharacterized protein [Branchiostoma lanceolatum]|uniref:uncharacterized protein n=1 Tax=Branchiostoma lanceolatum TaxID=7740 RepID=UPI0034531C0E
MLRVCEKLREVDAKARRLGLVRTETDYLRALLDAMSNMDRSVEVEILKSLGDVNLEKGQVDRAMLLYRAALLRCKDAYVGESLANRYRYAQKLVGRGGTIPDDYEPQTNPEKMSSPAKVAEKFLHLDRRLTSGYDKDSVLIEYTNLMIEGIINEDNLLETEAIKSLGDLFLKRGTETRDAPCLTKATALYNTALARCEGGPKLRQRQQKGHLSRDFPVTSSHTEVIGDAKGHKFMSPSEYISSLITKHVPDYRSYEKYLTTGDHALNDGNLDLAERKFATALKLIHDPNKPDRRKEAECLCRLGDVYVRRGKRTKGGRNFTQAAALYNAAMARTDKDKQSMTNRLQEIEQWFLRCTANVDSKSIPSDRTIRHQKRLKDIRARAKSQLEAIDQQHDPYKYDEDDPVMITVDAERAEAVKALFKTIAKNRQSFIQDLVDECIVELGPPPCKYAFIGLGSQATELVTPYSDLEFAILIEDGKDNDDTRRYFINLTHYLHLKVINLGETILPAMAISSLNDFQSEDPEKDWFFDSVTPRGFAFDGFMPWASKTPFGRDKTKSKPRLSLIQTPNEMAKFQQLDISVLEGYHLSDILRRFVFLAGEKELVNEYGGELSEIITSDLSSHFQSHLSALQLLYDNKENFANLELTGELLNVKKDIYRFPGIAIEILALCCKVTHSSAWHVIDRLKEMEKIGEENATHLTVLTSISAELRLRTYMANGGQKDSLSPLVQMENKSETREVPDSVLRSVFYIPNTKVLFRYYCRAIPLKQCIPGMVKEGLQSTGLIKMAIYDVSNECLGRIAKNLFLSQRSIRHLKAALDDAGSDAIKRSEIFRELGKYWESEIDFTKAKLNFEQSLMLRRGIYGDNTAEPGIAESLHNLGIIWNDLGDRKKAIDYFERSLAMTKTIYGDNTAHPLIAGALGNLGSCWGKLGDETKAITYFEQSLAMMKTIYGDNTAHPHIAQLLHHLGGSWFNLGDAKKAISYCEQSLTMRKTVYGDNTAHPDITQSLHNLGFSLSKLGDQKKAISYLEQSLTMGKTIYGEKTPHHNIAQSLNHLGISWSRLGDQKKAISYLEKSLTMRKTIYGDNTAHPHIADSLNNLGLSWSYLGDEKKAISCYEQSLTMMTTIHGDNMAHPHIAGTLGNLGISCGKLGDRKKAVSYFEQSLTMLKTIHGHNTAHPDIAQLLNNLGSSWGELGDQKKAISYFEQSHIMAKTLYGNKTAHPSIAQSLRNLGSYWGALGDRKKAISYLEQSLTIEKIIYGDNTAHPHLAASLNNLGTSWAMLGDQKKAISYFEQSLSMKKIIYGDNTAHPDIAQSLRNLASSWSELGDESKAISYLEQSLRMQKTLYGVTAPRAECRVN